MVVYVSCLLRGKWSSVRSWGFYYKVSRSQQLILLKHELTFIWLIARMLHEYMKFSSEASECTIQRKYVLEAFTKPADQGLATYSPREIHSSIKSTSPLGCASAYSCLERVWSPFPHRLVALFNSNNTNSLRIEGVRYQPGAQHRANYSFAFY
jgi:hypothetical protein